MNAAATSMSRIHTGAISALAGLVLILAPLASASAQESPERTPRKGPITEVMVVDIGGQPVPYAIVSMGNAPPRVADASGVARLPNPVEADSAQLVVRRLGYHPFGGAAKLDLDGQRFEVRLNPLARALNPRTISERRDTPLARRGFYDRLERVSRGATVGRFITPEELNLRNVSHISQYLAAEPYIRIVRSSGKPILTGRQHGCPMTIVVDGMRMSGTVEEVYTPEGQEEIRRMGGGPQASARFLQNRQSVDELLSAFSVSAMEIYPSAAGAPADIQRAAGGAACGILVIWSGGRDG